MYVSTEFSPALNRMAKFNNLVSELDFLAFCWCRYFGYELIKKSEALHELKE